jgi:antirestriction protein ArdC
MWFAQETSLLREAFFCLLQLGADVPQQEVRMQIQQLYSEVTAKIIQELEQGAIPWLKCWKGSNTGLVPQNAITKRAYSGINVPILWFTAGEKGYAKHAWLTYQQAAAAGGQVRKGEKSTFIVFTKPLLFKDKETEEEKHGRMLRVFSVFNIAQIDGIELDETTPKPEVERHAATERFIKATGARIAHGGDRAFYAPGFDSITLPHPADFESVEQYYGVALHELVHFSGAPHRLNRDMSGKYKDAKYAFEEIIAELGSAFLCAHLGIKAEMRHAGYIDAYLQVLKEDDKAFFRAAAKAQQAADYLRAHSETVDVEEQP